MNGNLILKGTTSSSGQQALSLINVDILNDLNVKNVTVDNGVTSSKKDNGILQFDQTATNVFGESRFTGGAVNINNNNRTDIDHLFYLNNSTTMMPLMLKMDVQGLKIQ